MLDRVGMFNSFSDEALKLVVETCTRPDIGSLEVFTRRKLYELKGIKNSPKMDQLWMMRRMISYAERHKSAMSCSHIEESYPVWVSVLAQRALFLVKKTKPSFCCFFLRS